MRQPIQTLLPVQNDYNPDQPRDDHGRFGRGGGESDSHHGGAAHKVHEAEEAVEAAHSTSEALEEMEHHPILGPISVATGIKLTNISKGIAGAMSKSDNPAMKSIGDKWGSAISKTDKFNEKIKEWAGERHGHATAAAISLGCAVAVGKAEEISGIGLVLKIIPGHKTACNLLAVGVGEVGHQLHLTGDTKVGRVVEKGAMGMVKAYHAVVKGVKAAVKPFGDAIGDIAKGGLVFSRRRGVADSGIMQVWMPQQN